ncbi:MAG: ABC transporter substrate-binding protein [Hyphomicrobiales bacterium]
MNFFENAKRHCKSLALITVLSLTASVSAQTLNLSGPSIWDSTILLELVKLQPLKDKGIDLKFIPWKSPVQLRAQIINQEIDIAIVPSITAALFANKDIRLKTIFAHHLDGNLVFLGRGGQIENLAALKGSKVAVPFKGDLPDLITKQLGLSAENTIYVKSPIEAMQLLLAGKVDNAFLAEPLATIAAMKGEGLNAKLNICAAWKISTDLNQCPPVGLVAFTSQVTMSGLSAEILADFEQNYISAFNRVKNNPALAASLLVEAFPNLNKTLLTKSFTGISGELATMSQSKQDLIGFFKVIEAIEADSIGGKLPDAEFFGE